DIDYEVYVPIKYFSETGIHSFYFPVVERNLKENIIKRIEYSRFLELTSLYAKSEFPDIDKTFTQQLMKNSIHNLDTFLSY
ncbi:hypothetical protein J9332_44350, partial [Aquimarina celericrescens]|nr:hypothetical protein [Aquimarina celericrescens]